ncbi:hypothetical protein SDC9_165078 [bioreactor metagenome]|uniref:Uncharacterized protein n=1 Tax=bioreactor metagenome TaxID=1076179 RepID=A0A645G0M9_9ZZZZ
MGSDGNAVQATEVLAFAMVGALLDIAPDRLVGGAAVAVLRHKMFLLEIVLIFERVVNYALSAIYFAPRRKNYSCIFIHCIQ